MNRQEALPESEGPPFAKKRAGDGNRTHVTSLEGWSSTIELHPQKNGAVDGSRTRDIHLGKVALYQLSYYRMRIPAPGRSADEETRTLTPFGTRS